LHNFTSFEPSHVKIRQVLKSWHSKMLEMYLLR